MRTMKTILLLLSLIAITSLSVACKSTPTGNREFIPGKGWVPA